MAATEKKITGRDLFETEVCGRCAGSGRYSWNALHGDRCYGCNGRGYSYSERGLAARNAWVAGYTKTVRADSLRPGDRIVLRKMARGVFVVATSEPDTLNEAGRYWNLTFEPNSVLGGYSTSPSTEIALPVTAAEKRAAYDAIAHLPGARGWPS